MYYLDGLFDVDDLERCALEDVRRIVIMTPTDASNRRLDEKVEPQLADARQIFMAKYLVGRCPDAEIITELAVDQAVK